MEVRAGARHALLLVCILVKIKFHGTFRLLYHLTFDKVVLKLHLWQRPRNLHTFLSFNTHAKGKESCHLGIMRWSDSAELPTLPETTLRNIRNTWSNVWSIALFDSKCSWILYLFDVVRLKIAILSDSFWYLRFYLLSRQNVFLRCLIERNKTKGNLPLSIFKVKARQPVGHIIVDLGLKCGV